MPSTTVLVDMDDQTKKQLCICNFKGEMSLGRLSMMQSEDKTEHLLTGKETDQNKIITSR